MKPGELSGDMGQVIERLERIADAIERQAEASDRLTATIARLATRRRAGEPDERTPEQTFPGRAYAIDRLLGPVRP